MIDMKSILVNEFDNSGIENNVLNYYQFIIDFSKKHNVLVLGTFIDQTIGWNTTGYRFDTPEDEVMFILKYNHVCNS
jgi:hypothetical protein